MYVFLIIGGRNMAHAKTEKNYWISAMLPICAYTFTSGLRFGRDVDYNIYYFVYKGLLDGSENLSDFEPVFNFFVLLFGDFLGLKWQIMVLFMSFFLIFSCVYFLKNYKECSAYALPWFVYHMSLAENTARWFFAFSFILLGLSFYLKDKKSSKDVWLFWFFFLMAFLTHYGIIIIEIIIGGFVCLKNRTIKPKYSLVLLALCAFFTSPLFLEKIGEYIALLGILTGRFEHYAIDADKYFVGQEEYQAMQSSQYLYCVIMIYYGYKIIKVKQSLFLPYNIALVGIISNPFLAQLEIGLRINSVLFVFQSFVLGYVFVYMYRGKMFQSLFLKIICILIFVNLGRHVIFDPIKTKDSRLLYIWDKREKDYIDPDSY